MAFSRRTFLASALAAPLALETSRAVGEENAASGRAPAMRFKDGRFRILQVTDLHLGYNCADGLKRAEQTLENVRKLLVETKPDLAIVTGDIVWLDATALEGGWAEAWRRVCEASARQKRSAAGGNFLTLLFAAFIIVSLNAFV